jgi:ABC-2 type transport system ATP-binding protein
LTRLTKGWLAHYLDDRGPAPDLSFETTAPVQSVLGSANTDDPPEARIADGPASRVALPLAGGPQVVINPPGGTPAALTSYPGAGSLVSTALGAAGSALSALPGQAAAFETAPLTRRLQVVGAPATTVRVQSATGTLTLFASVYDVGVGGKPSLPKGLVAPVHLAGVPAEGATVTIALPAVVLDLPPGHRLRVVLSTTDQAYATPTATQVYAVDLGGDRALTVPVLPTRGTGGGVGGLWVAVVVLAAVLLAGLLATRFRRGAGSRPVAELASVPIALEGLGKQYAGGYRAVTDLSFRVEAGQVLGLLGPNGAGKTTTLRMLVGLIHPTEGEMHVFGHRVTPGAPVLSRIGSFIEGPGFLPHLSGRANLELFWAASGRPVADAHLDVALEVAGLGGDVERRVKTYSQGMRQRLAIAQAMLGLPELLVLDEPTNGLDPPQIREMRDVLRRYAETGRTVIVSSHLLAEVEQTCTHVVVMHHGELVAQGPVADLVGSATSVVVDVSDRRAAAEVARALPGASEVRVTDTGITLRLVGTPRSELVVALVAAGHAVERVAPQRGLEEAFLALVGES